MDVMKKKKTAIQVIIVMVLCLIVAMLTIYTITKWVEKEKGLTFYLLEGGSFSSGWTYELTTDNVLVEVDKEIYDCFYDRYDYWEFQPIVGTSGEVTIHFIARYELLTVEEDCFSITYYVDENGTVTEISSDNKPEKINFDDDIVGLVWLKTVDTLTNYIIEKISFIVDGEFMRLFR